MQHYRYKPKWRLKNPDDNVWVTVYRKPDPDWFERCVMRVEGGHRFVRFALMANGEMYFGDGYSVIHWDICQINGPGGAGPLLVGVVVNRGSGWRVENVQWFLGSVKDERATVDGRGLLSVIPEWKDAVWAMVGHDPDRIWDDPWT